MLQLLDEEIPFQTLNYINRYGEIQILTVLYKKKNQTKQEQYYVSNCIQN